LQSSRLYYTEARLIRLRAWSCADQECGLRLSIGRAFSTIQPVRTASRHCVLRPVWKTPADCYAVTYRFFLKFPTEPTGNQTDDPNHTARFRRKTIAFRSVTLAGRVSNPIPRKLQTSFLGNLPGGPKPRNRRPPKTGSDNLSAARSTDPKVRHVQFALPRNVRAPKAGPGRHGSPRWELNLEATSWREIRKPVSRKARAHWLSR